LGYLLCQLIQILVFTRETQHFFRNQDKSPLIFTTTDLIRIAKAAEVPKTYLIEMEGLPPDDCGSALSLSNFVVFVVWLPL
jgi:hypothetical protein